MKNSFILLTLIVIGSVVTANGFDKPKAATGMAVMKSGSTFKLFYKGAKAGNVKVTIYNENGNTVFKENFTKIDNFMRPYNFSSLQEGIYTIEVLNEDGKQVEQINYTSGKIERLVNVMKITGSNDKYMLSVSNKGSDVFTVRIFNASNALVYEGKEQVTGDFAKIYNVGKLASGFSFEVIDQKGTTKTITF